MEISPKYLMKLVDQVEAVLWLEFQSYKNVTNYINKWHDTDEYSWENFSIYYSADNKIDLNRTLHNIDSEILLKIAIDMGVGTPDFLPSIPIFKNSLKEKYLKPLTMFDKALRQIEEDPDLAIGLANSTLESIIKHILENENLKTKWSEKDTLYSLTNSLLKEFGIYPEKDLPVEIKTIGSGLLSVSQSIEKLRSQKTKFHGKSKKGYLVDDPLYAYFIINSVTTVGQFVISFYDKKFNQIDMDFPIGEPIENKEYDDIPF